MRPTHLLAAVLLLSVPAFADRSVRRQLAQAGDNLEEALERNRSGNPSCRNNVEPSLMQLLDVIDVLKPSDDVQRFEAAVGSLQGLVRTAKQSGCSDGAVRDMGKGLDDLNDALDAARRRRPSGPPVPAQVQPGIFFSNAEVTEPGPPGPVLSIPSITVNGFQNSGMYLAWHWKPENGAWSNWETLPAVTVNSAQFTWTNPYRAILDYGLLRSADTAGTGRFVVHAGAYDMNGKEIQGVDFNFVAHYPKIAAVGGPPPPPQPLGRGGVVVALQPGPPPPPPPGQPGNVLPPPPPGGQPVGRDCGLGLDDPGCSMTRGGSQPMDRATWDGWFQSVKANLSESTRVNMVRDTLKTKWITARQLGALMELFLGENNRLDMARYAAPHVVDPNNALGYATKFLSSTRAREYNQLISSQR